MMHQPGDVIQNNHIEAFPKGAGCDIAPMKEEQAAPEKSRDEQEAEKLGVTVEKYRAMVEYARTLVRERPGIKPKKVSELVKKKFHIKTK